MTTPDGFSDNPLCAEMERRCAEMILVSQAVTTCADVFEQACEPRAPKAEWFGTGPGQWDRWMVGRRRTRGRKSWVMWTVSTHTWMPGYWPTAKTVVVPVAREGYPAPVGWQVVGE